jgi:PKD repeat protein
VGVVNAAEHPYYVALRDRAVGSVTMDAGVPSVTGPYTVQLAVNGATGATTAVTPRYVGTSEGLVTLVGATQTLSYVPAADFVSLGLLPDGRVYAGLWDGFEWAVKVWTPEYAAAGYDASATWVVPGSGSGAGSTFAQLDGVAFVDGQLWAFYWDGSSTDHAVQLDPDRDLAVVSGSSNRLSDTLLNVVTVSPNGKTLVSWERQPFSQNTSVVFWSAADAFFYGFPRIATVPLDGLVSGAAFDGTGEKLYVLTRNPDRIVVLE